MSSKLPSPFAATQQASSESNVLTDVFGETIAAPNNAMPGSTRGTRETLEPGTRIKHYELIRQLGAGGMGMVFWPATFALLGAWPSSFCSTIGARPQSASWPRHG